MNPLSHTPRAFSEFDSDWSPALRAESSQGAAIRYAILSKNLHTELPMITVQITIIRIFAVALVLT